MTKVNLSDISTKPPKGKGKAKAHYRNKFNKFLEEIEVLQRTMYAQAKFSILVVLQGMDASGKDGATRKVFKRTSPAHISVHSFKKPTPKEFAHDFLWRAHKVVPEKGMIQIFNRSHYEDVLIQRVHKWIDEETVQKRFRNINDFERLLAENGCTILKFYLHTSKEEQEVRLKERMEMPHKYWKHNDGDWEERKRWDEYRVAYEDAIENCGPDIPWHIIPADENYYKEYLIAKKVLEALKGMDLSYPPLETEMT